MNGVFDHVLTADRVSAYKPDPRAYRIGLDAFGLNPDQILFAAFAGWDAAGAKSFGYPTFWVNRQNQPAEELVSSLLSGALLVIALPYAAYTVVNQQFSV